MPDSHGSLCIILHAHIPYVLHHGCYPHGEAWLYEAAAETYLQLLEIIDDLVDHKVRPALTIGLTPVLLEQLAHDDFKPGFSAYLNDRIERSKHDRAEFEKQGQEEFAHQAARWERFYDERLAQFQRIKGDMAGEFAARSREGHIQILTSNATHAYMPILLNDQMIRAQLACGALTSRTRLGIEQPRGMWLPECGYRPTMENWLPSALYDDPRFRVGLEAHIARAGIDHFFVDSHLVAGGTPLGTLDHGRFESIGEAQLHWDVKRGWRSPLEPVGVASDPAPPPCFALARHPRISEQVWSSDVGYPSTSEYLDFHRKHGHHGLRYHKVTGSKVPAVEKQPYDADETFGRQYEHSQHFCKLVRELLNEHRSRTGRNGVCVAPFDAELFGHWWFEGPRFLRDVIFTLFRDPSVKLVTAEEALRAHPPDKVMRLPEGSWGENGNNSVWVNDRNRWMSEMEYRAEGQMLWMLENLPWRTNSSVREVMERAGRELLLLQASDWPFVVHTKGAVDYGIQRFSGHCTRFDRMQAIAEAVAAGRELTRLRQIQLEEVDAHDNIFPHIDLNWWVGL